MSWYVRDSTALLRASLPGGYDGLQYLIVGCDIVSSGPERLRGIWVPEHIARPLAESVGQPSAGRVAKFYDDLHANPVFRVHLRQSSAAAARTPPASPRTAAVREALAASLED